MTKNEALLVLLVLLFSLWAVPAALASSIDPSLYPYNNAVDYEDPGSANVKNVTLNYIYKSTDSEVDDEGNRVIYNDGINLLNLKDDEPYAASDAVGVYVGVNDDSGSASDPNPNLGEYEDGILNGEKVKVTYYDEDGKPIGKSVDRVLSGMEFITEDDLQVLSGDGIANDPGWIHLANYQQGGSTTYDTFNEGGGILELYLADLLTFEIDWNTEFTVGEWELALDPVKMAELLALPDSGMFDHIAITLKSSTKYAVYDFNLLEIFDASNDLLDPNDPEYDVKLLNFITPYTLGGTFNTNDFLNKLEEEGGVPQNISHINIWARDPSIFSTEIPEPATMALMGFGLIALAGVGRRNRKKS